MIVVLPPSSLTPRSPRSSRVHLESRLNEVTRSLEGMRHERQQSRREKDMAAATEKLKQAFPGGQGQGAGGRGWM